ncbi:MAG: hypothetical protein ACLUJG_03125 [Lawsonibacter sp.]
MEAVFAGLRPASTALIAAAGLSVAYSVFTVRQTALSPNSFPGHLRGQSLRADCWRSLLA